MGTLNFNQITPSHIHHCVALEFQSLVGKVICRDILKINSCRWTVGVDDIKNENDTKKNIFNILKEQLNVFFSYFFYVTDKYSTNDIIYA